MKRLAQITAAVLVIVVGVAAATTPARLTYNPALTSPGFPPADNGANLVPGTEKRLLWAGDEQPTEWAVVYIHGFSATRQEIAPVAERVARELDANLYETRLAGHGLTENALVDVPAEAWLDDMAEALAAGAALGEKVVVIATSTGATLATALHDHPLMQHVDSFVFLAPNFGLSDDGARAATGPAGKLLMRLVAGDSYSWEPANEAQGLYWATTYPTASIVEMVRLMDRVDASLPLESPQRWLVIYSDLDNVVSPQAIRDTLQQVSARDLQTVLVDTSSDLSHHVFTGDIMAPDMTAETVSTIVEFIRRPVP